MSRSWCRLALAAACLIAVAQLALAQKSGGILRIPALDRPASMSIHEETTIAVLGPMMGVFDNLALVNGNYNGWRLEDAWLDK